MVVLEVLMLFLLKGSMYGTKLEVSQKTFWHFNASAAIIMSKLICQCCRCETHRVLEFFMEYFVYYSNWTSSKQSLKIPYFWNFANIDAKNTPLFSWFQGPRWHFDTFPWNLKWSWLPIFVLSGGPGLMKSYFTTARISFSFLYPYVITLSCAMINRWVNIKGNPLK